MSTSMMNIHVLVCHKQEECNIEKFWKLESLRIEAKEPNDPSLDEIVENYTQNSIEKHKRKVRRTIALERRFVRITDKSRHR